MERALSAKSVSAMPSFPEFAARDEKAVAIVVALTRELSRSQKSRAEPAVDQEGSVQLDGKKIVDPKMMLSLRSGQILRLDKTRAVRIK